MTTPEQVDAPLAIDSATLDFVYAVTSQGPIDQLRRAEALDAKLIQVFASASVVIGLAGLGSLRTTDDVLLYGAIGCYGIVALATLVGIWVRSYWHPFHTDTLLDDSWRLSAFDTKYALADELPKVYEKNKSILNLKGWATRAAILATGLEVIAVGLLVLSSEAA